MFFILVAGLIISTGLGAQELHKIKLDSPVATDNGDYECPNNTIFSQPPVNFQYAYVNSFISIQVLYDNFYGLTEPIHGIRYWQVSNLSYPVEFTIEFYTDNGGSMGTLVHSWVMDLSPTFTTIDGIDVIDIDLPTSVNMSAGWLGINGSDNRLIPGGGEIGWMETTVGDYHIIFSDDLVNYYHNNGVNFAF